VGLFSLASFVVLGMTVKSGPTSFDKAVAKFFASHRTHAEVTIAGVIGTWTAPAIIGTLAMGILTILIYRKRPWLLQDFIPATLIVTAGVASTFAKSAFHRVRPGMNFSTIFDPEPSFPSSHTIFIAVAGSSFLFIFLKGRLALVSAIIAVTVIVGISRLVLGVHWLTDILGSILLSLAVYFIFASLDQNLRRNSDESRKIR